MFIGLPSEMRDFAGIAGRPSGRRAFGKTRENVVPFRTSVNQFEGGSAISIKRHPTKHEAADADHALAAHGLANDGESLLAHLAVRGNVRRHAGRGSLGRGGSGSVAYPRSRTNENAPPLLTMRR